jgi:hypothetical protein
VGVGQYLLFDEDRFVTIRVSVEEFQQAIRKANRAFLRFNRAYKRAQGGPGPLCINGHEYHRRQRRRVRKHSR